MVSSVYSLICALSLVSVSYAVSLNLPAMDPAATSVTCPDGGICPDRNTCCMTLSGRYGCCPLENAVCCSDKQTCCPRGTVCSGGRCYSETAAADALLQAIVVDKQAPSEDKVESEPATVQKVEEGEEKGRCPDGSYCASGYHCCSTGSAYRCCQYGWACCGGGYYCCSLESNDDGESAAHRFVREIKTK